jgi:alpha-amylase/alpha-mannosidase (GH57 family)
LNIGPLQSDNKCTKNSTEVNWRNYDGMKPMPKIKLCFLWHMHQPLYKDLVSGEYRLPWTRLHALKDYYGMVKILEDFPEIHQTFNLVPSLLVQIEEYASGKASDPFQKLASKPAEELTVPETEMLLKYFFQANEERVIRRFPRYAELFHILQRNDHNVQRSLPSFDAQMLRDLQVLSQLAWFDEHYLEHDRGAKALLDKARNYSREDQVLIAEKECEALGKVLNVYRDFAQRGQIELSTSAYYHPILPLICDSNIAHAAHPYVSLPAQFAYPQDAQEQLQRARTYMASKFGVTPSGLWPSEGAVSDATLAVASQAGFSWTASDNQVLARTLNLELPAGAGYQPYRWTQAGNSIDIVFRDRRLSDLIALVYSHMEPAEAAIHFIKEVRRSCEPVLKTGRDALVPVILDGENAWESYVRNGRPFLRELYSRLAKDPLISTLTMSEGIQTVPKGELTEVFPGSWIDASFDVWIGAEEDNLAWEYLLQARQTFDSVLSSGHGPKLSEKAKQTAWEELLIAEGSDWCWWYGPEHASANKAEFDQLYRDHLANVYRLLGKEVPSPLSKPIVKERALSPHEQPGGFIQPHIDGKISSRAEWAGAGRYRVHPRSGAMHSQRSPVQDLHYGTDGQNMYFRVDFTESLSGESGIECCVRLRNPSGERFEIRTLNRSSGACEMASDLPDSSFVAVMDELYEAKISMSALHIRRGESLFLQISISRDGLPVAFIPVHGELEIQSGLMAAYAF